MKQTLRLRGGLCLEPKPIIHLFYKIFLTFIVVLVSCVCSIAQVPASSPEAGPAAGAVDEIKPLEIGDTIPEALWNLPLQVVKAGQEGGTTVTLNDYKGKLIILDFWATNCGSCVSAIPKLNTRQQEFNDRVTILPVSYERKERIATSFSKNPKLKKSSLGTVAEDKELNRYFPHEYISHVIWIDADGIVKAITKTDYVSAENIRSVLNKEPIDWPVKRDVTDYDYGKPLLALNQKNLPAFSMPDFEYHSTLTGYLGNINRLYQSYPDTINATFRVYAVNHSIVDLYTKVLNIDGFPISHISVEADYPERFFFDKALDYQEEWNRQNTFTYEAVFPLRLTEKQRQKEVIDDLDLYLGLQSGFEEVKVKCLIITDIIDHMASQIAQRKERGITLGNIVYFLNHSLPGFPVINETKNGEDALVKIGREGLTDLPLLKNRLLESGFSMVEEERSIRMFVLRDIKVH